MKKLLFRCISGILPFIALASCAYAQTNNPGSSSGVSTELAYSKAAIGKSHSAGTMETTNINEKALKSFNKTYKNGNARWFVINDGFLAEFQENGIKTKVFYTHKGNTRGTIRSYFEDNMPKNIRHLVKSNYYDYNINLVQEVTVGNETAYLVKIEDKTSYKTIRVIDGAMDEYEAFDKVKN